MNITVSQVEGPSWTSPDGKINCYTIIYQEGGVTKTRETYSKTIAQVGWTGEVMEYTKNNRVYVKQPPREDYINTPSQGSPQPAGGQISLDLVNRLESAVTRLEGLLNKPSDTVIPSTVTNEQLDQIIEDF